MTKLEKIWTETGLIGVHVTRLGKSDHPEKLEDVHLHHTNSVKQQDLRLRFSARPTLAQLAW